jgi:hypothetical protein
MHIYALFAWLISHQSAVLFSHNKPATSNQPAVRFSQNKPAPAISHQLTEQAVYNSIYYTFASDLFFSAQVKYLYCVKQSKFYCEM